MQQEVDLSVQAFDYIHLAFSRFHNHQVNGCIRLNGHIQNKVLEEALNLTVNDLPMLSCCFYNGEYHQLKGKLETEVINTFSALTQVNQIMGEVQCSQ